MLQSSEFSSLLLICVVKLIDVSAIPVGNSTPYQDGSTQKTTKDLSTLLLQRSMLDDLGSLLGMGKEHHEQVMKSLSNDHKKPTTNEVVTGLRKCRKIEEIKEELNLDKEITVEALVLLIFEKYLQSEKEKQEYKQDVDTMFITMVTRYKIQRSEDNIPPTWKDEQIAQQQRQTTQSKQTIKKSKQSRSRVTEPTSETTEKPMDSFDVIQTWNHLDREQKWKILFSYVGRETVPEPFSGIKKASDKLEAMNFHSPEEKAKAVKNLYDSLNGNISNYIRGGKSLSGPFAVVVDKCVADALQCL